MSDNLDRLKTALSDRYAIEEELGAGGMATVYLAHDIKHARKVAVKVLRPELAAVIGAERFLHEIKVTANLQHPHILPLHDSGEAGSFLYYVMPYVEGESLRDKLNHEKQLSIEESLEITKAVARALDYAHRHEVIHRDIKPENILLQDGQPVVSDFGIALAVTAAGGHRLTETGLSLGTPHYMSPEQAMGDREVDARSDVYALACVTYEMLVGEPPHTGPTAQAILAKVITEKPQRITIHRDTVPPHVDAAVQKALAKLPADRFATAVEFTDALTRPGVVFTTEHEKPQAVVRGRISVDRRIAIAAVVLVLAIGAAIGWWVHPSSPAEGMVTRLAITPRPTGSFANFGPTMAIAPDGQHVVYVGGRPPEESALGGRDQQKLFVRPLGELEAEEIPGTQGAYTPFFSPDGRWVGFITDENVMKVPLEGGRPVIVARRGSSANVRGASWGSNDVIIFSPAGISGLMRVPASGGVPEPVPTALEGDTVGLRWPSMLPGGTAALVTIWNSDLHGAEIGVVSLETGEIKRLGAGNGPRYVASGHLAFIQSDGLLLAVEFDLDELETVGRPVPIEENILVYRGGAAQYSISQGGTLVYRPIENIDRSLILVNREGTAEPLSRESRHFTGPGRFSPDGMRVAIEIEDGLDMNIWVYDRVQNNFSVLTNGSQNSSPSWTRDGTKLVWNSNRRGPSNLYWQPWDGSGPIEVLVADSNEHYESAWSVDLSLFFHETSMAGGEDISVVSLGGDGKSEQFLNSEHNERMPSPSPDGRWVAFVSDESGRNEVYVSPYPASGARMPVSRAGGTDPGWAPSGRELFYRNGDSLMAAQVNTGSGFRVMSRDLLFREDFVMTSFDVHPDGNTFLMTRREEDPRYEMVIVFNWFEEVRRRMAELGGGSE